MSSASPTPRNRALSRTQMTRPVRKASQPRRRTPQTLRRSPQTWSRSRPGPRSPSSRRSRARRPTPPRTWPSPSVGPPAKRSRCRSRTRPPKQSSSPKSRSVPRPKRVAITGGIGAGKSEALQAFARHGAAVSSSDEIVHDLIERDEEVRAALLERLGTTDRAEIAAVVFADRQELDWLERLLHPRVAERQRRWFEQQDGPLAVVEIPLLYETGGEARFDAVVAITAPREVRERRARVPLGGRSERLIPDEEKLRRADFGYVNDGSLEQLE